MPKDKETSNHPCHFLSLPSARRFWCRHCMAVFEDAITRWRHSRTCRYGVVSNFMRRRELEAKALQNTTKPNPIEARLEQSVDMTAILSADGNGNSNLDGEGSSSDQNLPKQVVDPFRCFICHSQFSSLEEMRHHVKFPCNHKKTVAENNQTAVTIYIDEFTDRSRSWEPAPQPQQEEVYTSEFVSTVEAQQTAQAANLQVSTVQEESMITAPPPIKKQENITPTNIYVNEQGETVIEVENLDLNSEGGELSLAHLLTQLSQQGIVFDKSKSGQMQARQEMTVSDPASGKIYTTSSIAPGVAQEDEGQPTAEDAANTLAQLAGFRGFRNSQELYEGTHIVPDQSKPSQSHIIETAQGYEYHTSMPETTDGENQVRVDLEGSQPQLNVNYEYEYYPSTQASSISTDEHIAIQSMVQSGAQEYQNVKIEEQIVHHLPVHFYDDRSSSHEVTYITTAAQDGQQTDATSIQTIESDGISVDGQRVIIDNQTEPVIIQQYEVGSVDSSSPQFVNYPVAVSETENSTQEFYLSHQNSNQPLNHVESSQEVMCHTEEGHLNEAAGLSEHIYHHAVENNISESNETTNPGSEQLLNKESETENNSEEFSIQTVSLQEIVEAESSNPVSFGGAISSHTHTDTGASNSQIICSVENNHLHSTEFEDSSNTSITHSVDTSGNLVVTGQNDHHGVDTSGNVMVTTQSDMALADKYVISEGQTSGNLVVTTQSDMALADKYVISEGQTSENGNVMVTTQSDMALANKYVISEGQTSGNGNLVVTTQSDMALADKYVISEGQSCMEASTRPSMPVFVVSSSGLQLVNTDQKTAITKSQPDL